MTYVASYLPTELAITAIITVHYFEYSKEFSFAGERHPFWEFMYVNKGQILVKTDNEQQILKSGQIIFHKPNEFHALKAHNNQAPSIAVASFVSASPLLKFFEHKVLSLSQEEKELLATLLSNAKQIFQSPLNIPQVEKVCFRPNLLPGEKQLLKISLEYFLLKIRQRSLAQVVEHLPNKKKIQIHTHLSNSKQAINDESVSAPIDLICSYLEDHIFSNLSLKELSTIFAFSCSNIESLFHKHKGCGVYAYFTLLKMEKAKELLRENRLSVGQIAILLQFSSQQHFSKRFKQLCQLTPSAYQHSVNAITKSIKGDDI
ncbi:AraC family transcriptional regulator [Amygdalobacter nucleatus]|uniref:Transcriptional regulator, AraC family n=1 Tax=Amygdalobacter nucleatus TaxID=3029274 RepID=A0A133YGE1_9FIRM|nr:AraC family transcriptional regulator [Amygdalobacter nucleatus]KXB42255.1 transcriptional regulator, AraC family [Amygdalobacter nucleatus]MDF0486368.1 AraC family transcriptional regulator [Amygdalobacter nucleatus]WEG37095.1 AraC family transcriptional regulator [Amygdalobacter nucleatus]